MLSTCRASVIAWALESMTAATSDGRLHASCKTVACGRPILNSLALDAVRLQCTEAGRTLVERKRYPVGSEWRAWGFVSGGRAGSLGTSHPLSLPTILLLQFMILSLPSAVLLLSAPIEGGICDACTSTHPCALRKKGC